MAQKILIVEDESLVALDLKLILTKAGYRVCGIAASVKEALEIIEAENPDMVLLDIFLKGPLNGIDLAKTLTTKNIAFVYLSANFQESILEKAKSTQPYGFLVKPFREKELLIALDVAFYRHFNSLESKLRQEKALEEVFKKIVKEPGEWRQKLLSVATQLQPYVPFDFISMVAQNNGEFEMDGITFLRVGFDEYQSIGTKELLTISKVTPADFKKMQTATTISAKAELLDLDHLEKTRQKYPIKRLIADTFRLKSCFCFPLLLSNGEIAQFSFYSRKAETYTMDHVDLLNRLQRPLLAAFEAILGNEGLNVVTEAIPKALRENRGKNKPAAFEGIIGKSHQMLSVFDNIAIVAPLNTSVLILGESGTGKEAIAKSIHRLSPRRDNPLVTVNCASLPPTLIESELFGHEKGSFTGATEKRIGKFELADKGTIFLDEIGEMPAELQVKLLRVLQEQEIERIGGRAPIKINVRIIAATNRNLQKEVEEGRFRLDLYYRLYVFPILIPALRERGEDIGDLANHFMAVYSRKSGKNVNQLSPQVLAQLKSYHWPGNVRELEHLIERSVLLASGSEIKEVLMPMLNQKPQNQVAAEENVFKSIEENSRDHILAVLRKCNGRVSGPGGAAEILEVPPSTLHSKIKKLGIKKWTA
ncbi:sigma 54-interacting transcriptional regulator [Mucilaginibacter sp. L3T2-6]|uniref:sigma 54-interacting transcriptional regulator n=1 Tax=Mucilaginibacter sp. L3T2-6 TaxID=3062491 RepID=UPI0026756888|nr:sigma 54-interacting transcriptional regulator [Mucilaginibacter sp. L3T2-6]MDO3641325.1 sigma 54-interacting transcriptional regulator [Mucilaginibacter sp. L3T2-6]MDV6213914.1 sigma 54-interacting transcriptional regulator [Mucilaginibacter sp. L3T2-6]